MLATTCPSSIRSRRLAPPSRRACAWPNSRPANRRVSRKLASRFFRSVPAPHARRVAAQAADERPACTIFSYQTVSGYTVAPNNAGGGNSVFLSPGIVTPSPINNPRAGSSIAINGYGVLNISAAAAQGGRQAMSFTPNNGQSPTDFVYMQYVTNDPQNNQMSPYEGGGSVPYLDAPSTNLSGTVEGNFANSGVYNNNTPLYTNSAANFYDHPDTGPGGGPLGFSTYLIEKNSGTILQQINWTAPGYP